MPIEFRRNHEGCATLAEAAGKRVDEIIGRYKKENTPVLLMLSGGSSLSLLTAIDAANLSSDLTVCVVDERFSLDPTVNNMAQVMQTDFFRKANEANAKIIDTRPLDGETQDQLAKRFNNALVSWIHNNPNGKIVATLGMGPDGHIAGIMPENENAEKFYNEFDREVENEYIVSYDAGEKNPFPFRVTTNLPFLRRIDNAVAYIAGENKREAWNRLNQNEGELARTPARVLGEIKGDVYLFTDL